MANNSQSDCGEDDARLPRVLAKHRRREERLYNDPINEAASAEQGSGETREVQNLKLPAGRREGGRGASSATSVPFLVRVGTPPSNIPFKVASGARSQIRLASTRGVRFEAKTSPRVR